MKSGDNIIKYELQSTYQKQWVVANIPFHKSYLVYSIFAFLFKFHEERSKDRIWVIEIKEGEHRIYVTVLPFLHSSPLINQFYSNHHLQNTNSYDHHNTTTVTPQIVDHWVGRQPIQNLLKQDHLFRKISLQQSHHVATVIYQANHDIIIIIFVLQIL